MENTKERRGHTKDEADYIHKIAIDNVTLDRESEE
jgi:hypothetical protein